MTDKTKEILEKQLQLLSEYSNKEAVSRDLIALTRVSEAMCEIARTLEAPSSPMR